jgi:hypothetical protein
LNDARDALRRKVVALTETSPVTLTETSLDELRERIANEPGSVYAILDACDEPRVPQKVSELGDCAVSLYRGWAEEQYWAIAPYLVVVDSDLLDWIVENLRDDPWGIFVVAQCDLTALRKHFRRFLLVKHPDGRQMYFRFYDPRVLPSFLGSCTAEEAQQFLGPVQWFCVPARGSDFMVCKRIEGKARDELAG